MNDFIKRMRRQQLYGWRFLEALEQHNIEHDGLLVDCPRCGDSLKAIIHESDPENIIVCVGTCAGPMTDEEASALTAKYRIVEEPQPPREPVKFTDAQKRLRRILGLKRRTST